MNQAEAIEKISKALSHLTFQVAQENFAGFFSKNRLLEDLLLPAFSLILAAPSLQNLNVLGQNNAYLDLGDDETRVGIQVTTEHDAAKVTKTLQGVLDTKLYDKYDRIVVFMLRTVRPTFKTKTRNRWSTMCTAKFTFAPERDIIALPQLLSLIGARPYSEIMKIQELFARSIIGEEHVDVLGAASRVTRNHLSFEKRTARYIPGVFIETRETKQLCRCFCHPVLFFRRSIEIADQLNLRSWNSFLDRAGLAPLPIPNFSSVSYEPTLAGVQATSSKVWHSFEPIRNVLKSYKDRAQRSSFDETIPASKRPFYEENRHVLVNEMQIIPYYLRDIEQELQLAEKRIFFLTGHAGQGKTNLLCDLVENFLIKHEIPCAFLSARELGLKQNNDLGQIICDHIFAKKIATLDEAARLLSKEALRLQKPFVLVIDGLNEHRDIKLFGQQLETVVDLLLQYPAIKCLFSCRSEFFGQRFSKLINGHLRPDIFVCEATEGRLEEEERAQLIDAYFEFFSIDRNRVTDHVCEALAKDMLLLRFFCEVYGSRGKTSDYVQPNVLHFYREELFESYLKGKLQTAEVFLQSVTNTITPASENQKLLRVLEICAEHMVSRWEFGNVPMDVIPAHLQEALYSLLDEELIIRRDTSALESGVSPNETINFTFDEFRDFMLSQYLVQKVFARSQSDFLGITSKTDPEREQPTEGLKRFMFYASRKKKNVAFSKFYRSQSWYSDVYYREVFNLDVRNLEAEDGDRIRTRLGTTDHEAIQIARTLAYRWNRHYWPILNLGLLLDHVEQVGPSAYDALISKAIGIRDFRQRDSIAAAFSSFVNEHVQDLKTRFSIYEDVVRFLIFLLPVESTYALNSPAYDVMVRVIEQRPEETTAMLLSFLDLPFEEHQPFVWRLLYEAMRNRQDERIVAAADAGLNKAQSPRSLVEIKRIQITFTKGDGQQ
jgi:hypothetical protein